jgi:hypothetical protein
MRYDIKSFADGDKARLVESRWASSETLWDTVKKTYEQNTAIYENRSAWLAFIPERRRKYRVQANRIFVNMEAVINSLIANPPGITLLPSRAGDIAQDFARKVENYMRKKFVDLDVKETMRMGLRNLYFARLIVIKPFWNPEINDFDFRAIDPRTVRFGKYARKEQDSEFAIEEISDNLCAVIERFPAKKQELMQKYGLNNDVELYIKNPDVKYKEAWIQDYCIFKLDNIILDTIKNPYWDWEGILITDQEEQQLNGDGTPENQGLQGQQRRDLLQQIKLAQDTRVQEQVPQATDQADAEGATPDQQVAPQTQYKQFFFNYFENPRKPYIYNTIFNNENTPIGRTDMITLSSELQRSIDKRKMDIDENCELANGVLKVDASVMGKSDAQRIRFETKGIIWGKGVKDGVTRETGQALPQMVFDDMLDSRSEIDNIMAASSAFRGEREGQETKAGRLALVQQSYLRLNELVQVVDSVYTDVFSWGFQLMKIRYTEYHEAQIDNDGSREVIELIQDDFEAGSEIKVISGKTLPVDDEFKFDQAQNDFEKGALGLTDYLEIAHYDDSKEVAKRAVEYKINPVVAVGISPEDMQKLQPQQTEDKPPSITINYADLTPDAQVQLLAKVGIQANPEIVTAEKAAQAHQASTELALKKQAQDHSQKMAVEGNTLAKGDQIIKARVAARPVPTPVKK